MVEMNDNGSILKMIALTVELNKARFDHLTFNLPYSLEIKPLEIITGKVIINPTVLRPAPRPPLGPSAPP